MKNRPLISVIIPVEGRYPLVRLSIESVLSQSAYSDNTEIIVVEDKDTKESIKVKLQESFPMIKVFTNTNDEGPGGCRNTGLNNALGEYIVFLDSDDELGRDFFKFMVSALNDRYASAVICLSNAHFQKSFNIKERLKLYPLRLIRDGSFLISYIFNHGYLYASAFYLCQISHMMIKASRIKDLRFDYTFRKGAEDWYFFSKILETGRIRIVFRRLLLFRYTSGSTTDNPVNRQYKWQAYALLAKKLSNRYKNSLFFVLFRLYITLLGGKNAK